MVVGTRRGRGPHQQDEGGQKGRTTKRAHEPQCRRDVPWRRNDITIGRMFTTSLRALMALMGIVILSVACGGNPPAPATPAQPATPAARATAASQTFDVIIANGRVVDGTGAPWFRADVGITGDRITAIGNLASAQATTRIDAAGQVVAPGFIDLAGRA